MEISSAKEKATRCNVIKLPYQLILCCQTALLFICLSLSINQGFPSFVVALSGLVFLLFMHSYLVQSKLTFTLGEVLLYCFLLLLYPRFVALHTMAFTFAYGMIFIGFIALCHKIVMQEYYEEQS